jgi:hypothetical protein
MATPAKKLPEVVISDGQLVDDAAEFIRLKAEQARIDKQISDLTATMRTQAISFRDTQLDQGEVVGLIKIIKDDQPSVQVQFRIDSSKAELDIADAPEIDDLFKDGAEVLFGTSTILGGLKSSLEGEKAGSVEEGLLSAMKADNRNPWDFLKLVPKDCFTSICTQYPQVRVSKRVMPKDGFLANLKSLWKVLCPEAIEYVKEYVKGAIFPSVSIK